MTRPATRQPIRHAKLILLPALLCLAFHAGAQDPAPPQITTLDQALDVAQSSDFGKGEAALEFIRTHVLAVQSDPVARNDLANTLADLLDDPASTHAFKLFACRQLYLIGGVEQVEELLLLMADPALAHAARYALEVIPSPELNEQLWKAAETATGPVAAGIAATLAARGGPLAVSRLAILAEREEPEVIRAAIIGLGRTGGAQAESSLRLALLAHPENYHTEIHEALLACASGYEKAGSGAEADRLLLDLMAEGRPIHVRTAAFNQLAALRGGAAAPMIADAIATGDPIWVRAAMAGVRTSGGPDATAFFAEQLATATPDAQVLLIQALADRGDPVALNTIIGGLDSPDPAVHQATIDALGRLGNETTVLPLLAEAAGDDPEAAKRARDCLVRLADAGVNGVLLAYLEGAADEDIPLLAGILADRQVIEAVPFLLEIAATETGDLRASACAAIGMLAGETDLPSVAGLLYAAEDQAKRNETAQALTAIFKRTPASEARTATLSALYTDAPDTLSRAALLALYRALGDDSALPLVHEAIASGDPILHDAAITALAGWPAPTPLEAVYAVANGTGTGTQKKTALDGYIRMLRMQTRPAESTVAGFKQALALSSEPGVVRSVLAGLSELKSEEVLDIAESLLGDDVLHADAAIAAEKIRSKFYTFTASADPDSARRAADGNIDTFWQTPGPQEPGQWIEIDLFRRTALKGIVIEASKNEAGFPRGYRIYLYDAAGLPGEPVAVGDGTPGATRINFARPFAGRILRIEQTGTTEETPWIIHEIRVIPE